jgi:predicted DNA-binding transcriptional regulator AlpA
MRSETLLNIHEVLTLCGRSPKSRQTIYDWIDEAGFPPGFKINGKGPRQWTRASVVAWLKAQQRKHAAIVKRAA